MGPEAKKIENQIYQATLVTIGAVGVSMAGRKILREPLGTSNLYRHNKRFHVKPVVYSCDLCTFTCYRKGDVKRHKITVHKHDGGYKCEICQYYTADRFYIRRHIENVHSDRPKGQSKGEAAIEKALIENLNLRKYIYVSEKIFSDLKSPKGGYLRYDFAVVINEARQEYLLIEYDGEQHFKPVQWFSLTHEEAISKHKEIVRNDRIKDKYAEDHCYGMLRIRYDQYDKVEEMVVDFLGRYGLLD